MRPSLLHRLALVVLLLLAAGPAAAADLDALRAEGVVAERFDGYVEVREPGHPGAKAVVERVNERRRAIYEKRAESQDVPVGQVGRVYARQIFEKLPEGAYFRREEGGYVRK